MPKITSVEPQKKNPHRFNIFLDGQFGFGADEDLVVDHRLIVGKVIESGDLEKILFDAEVGKLMERVYGLLTIRMRSEKEIRDYLRNLSFKRKLKEKDEISPIVIESTIDRAIKKGLVNDLEFAKLWVESRSKKKGLQVIKQELFKKGISREMVDQALSQELRIKDQDKVAEELLNKKMQRWSNLPVLEFKKKALDFLMRRGFEYSLAREVIEKIAKIR
jgi:regulatory protein